MKTSSALGRRLWVRKSSGQRPTTNDRRPAAGFSLLELLIAVALLTVIMGAIFAQINEGQKNSAAEQMKLDLFQESREFMDQMSRDLRASGYPNTRNFSTNPASPPEQSPEIAVGLVKLDVGELWFESSTDGCGSTPSGNTCTVSVIHYKMVTDGPNCPCLVRSQTPKVPGDPLTGQAESDQTEVQNVINGTTSDPIFQAFYADGTAVSLPIQFSDSPPVNIANINTIAVTLKVQSPYLDPKTQQKPTMTLLGTVRLNNCSLAYPGTGITVMGCT